MKTRHLFLVLVLCLASHPICRAANSPVKEGLWSISVRVSAPIPDEVSNVTQAQALARDAAVTLGQTHILNYIMEKKAHSGRKLAEAEIPSLDVQQRLRGMVSGARVQKTVWEKDKCWVTLVMSKSDLKRILRKN